MDGSSPVRLTSGNADSKSTCTPDGKWVYYVDESAEVAMRVPTAGGPSERAPGMQGANYSMWAALSFSPDGKTLVGFASLADPTTNVFHPECILVSNYEEPKPSVRSVVIRPDASSPGSFTPDGKSLAYAIEEKGHANIWVQPLDGSKGHAITNFTSEQIDEFHWSPDGKRLAVVRGDIESNVVLFREASQ
jgi:eukaryotic-like serine/threonine-protein kinase